MNPGYIQEVMDKFQQFNPTQSGMAAFSDWCEERGFVIPFLDACDYDPLRTATILVAWKYCTTHGIKYSFDFEKPEVITLQIQDDIYSFGDKHSHNLTDAVIRFAESTRSKYATTHDGPDTV